MDPYMDPYLVELCGVSSNHFVCGLFSGVLHSPDKESFTNA